MLDMDTAVPAGAASIGTARGKGGRAAAIELNSRLAALPALSYHDLRAEWRRLYRSHPPKRISRDLLELGVAWKMQEKVLGGLGATLKRRLIELAGTMATKGDLARVRAVTLRPGAKLVREWHGKAHELLVLEDGFEWRGEHWRSLTAIAGAITGTHWSGPRFFGLGGPRRAGGGARADSPPSDPAPGREIEAGQAIPPKQAPPLPDESSSHRLPGPQRSRAPGRERDGYEHADPGPLLACGAGKQPSSTSAVDSGRFRAGRTRAAAALSPMETAHG